MTKITLFLLAFLPIFAFADTKKDIKNTVSNIKKNEVMEANIHKKLDELGKILIQNRDEKQEIDKKIADISENLDILSKKYENYNLELDELKDENKKLTQMKFDSEDEIVQAVLSELIILDSNIDFSSEYDVIDNEIINNLHKIYDEQMKNLSQKYLEISNALNDGNAKIKNIKNEMETYKKKQDELSLAQKQKDKIISELKHNKNEYIKNLEEIEREKQTLRQTLEKLQIIDKQELNNKQQKKNVANKNNENIKQNNTDDEFKDTRVDKIETKVKQYASGYGKTLVKSYKGAKTISPISGAKLKTKFGNYKDPIYDIQFFNENIVLTASVENSQVLSVLPGKVVFAQDTPVLEKVVIISHSNGMHTIYGHLSDIPSEIKVGKVIKKGYVIGRVRRDLTFEVTWEKYHIDPLDLIVLK